MASKYDIDTYLNPLTPRNPFHNLPRPISHWFGYRPPHSNSTTRKPHILIIWAFCFTGAFLGVALIEAVYMHLPLLSGHRVPVIIASFGAAAILEYNTIESPLAQPRNLVFGHFLAALIGVSITKLFELLPPDRFEELRWLAGALAVGTASVVMSMTKTVHPPAGATALLTATTAEVTELGWWTLALVLLGCMLMLTSALILNNIVRQFPMYWWTPADLSRPKPVDIEKTASAPDAMSDDGRSEQHLKPVVSASDNGSGTLRGSTSTEGQKAKREELNAATSLGWEVVVSKEKVSLPEWLQLSDFEKDVLAMLQERLVEGEVAAEPEPPSRMISASAWK